MAERPRLVGINHVALEVGDIDDALAFYGQLFDLSLRGRSARMAFVDIGDQFIALMQGRSQPPDRTLAPPRRAEQPDDHDRLPTRHFGLVVDDKEATRRALERAGAEILRGRGLDFRDPWGNFVQVVQYDEVQFTKADHVLRAMSLELGKTPEALAELEAKGITRPSE
jgi:lactoylglutathione lyase